VSEFARTLRQNSGQGTDHGESNSNGGDTFSC
jgi:uncharacterized protein (DUF1501 family)